MRPLRRNLHLAVPGVPPAPFFPVLALAMIVFPVLRGRVGYDTASPFAAAARCVLAVFLSWAFWVARVDFGHAAIPANRGGDWLFWAVVLCLVADLAVFVKRWNEQRTGQGGHPADAGWSWLTLYTPLPPWLCEIVFVPAVLFGVGWLISATFSLDLGWFLMLAGWAYAWVASWETRLRWRTRINIAADVARAQQFGEQVDAAQGGSRSAAPQEEPDSIHDTATVGARPRASKRPKPFWKPAAASWRTGSGNAAPDVTSWLFRRRGRTGGRVPARIDED